MIVGNIPIATDTGDCHGYQIILGICNFLKNLWFLSSFNHVSMPLVPKSLTENDLGTEVSTMSKHKGIASIVHLVKVFEEFLKRQKKNVLPSCSNQNSILA